jgi:hypothetical protein
MNWFEVSAKKKVRLGVFGTQVFPRACKLRYAFVRNDPSDKTDYE